MSAVPLSLPSEPCGRDEDGIIIAVIRVLVTPTRRTMALLLLLPRGLRSPAPPRRVLSTVWLTPLHGSWGGPIRGARIWGLDWRAAGVTGAGGITRRLCGGGALTLWRQGLRGSWGDMNNTVRTMCGWFKPFKSSKCSLMVTLLVVLEQSLWFHNPE